VELRNMYSSPNIIRMMKSRKMRLVGYEEIWVVEESVKLLVGKSERKRPLGRPRQRGCVTEMNLGEIAWPCLDWTDVAQDRDWWRAPVGMALNLLVPQNAGSSWVWVATQLAACRVGISYVCTAFPPATDSSLLGTGYLRHYVSFHHFNNYYLQSILSAILHCSVIGTVQSLQKAGWYWRMASSGMLRRVTLVRTYIL
jgi:hypothetical protein